jgi:nickel/cobalt transporter (NicO) family protein
MSIRARLALVLVVIAAAIGNRYSIAHDIPKQRVDRTIQLRFEPNRLYADYLLELDDTTIAADLKRIRPETPLPPEPEEWLEAYGRLVAPLISRGLLIDGPGIPMTETWRISAISRSREQHTIYEFRFVAELSEPGDYRFRDENFGTSDGLSRLGVDWRNSVVVRSDGDYPRLATDRPLQPLWMLEDEEIRKTKQWRGKVEWEAGSETSPTAVSEPIRPTTASERRPTLPLG